jgi:hypothetical protein
MKELGIPSVSGMTGALKSGAIGAVGGAAYGLSQKFLGTGIWGALAGIALAGSVLKGVSSEIVSTVLGFQIGQQLIAGGLKGSTSTPSTTQTGSGYTVI